MRTEYSYIEFELLGHKTKTTIWSCKNKKSGDVIGLVEWYCNWRQYCFMPKGDTVFSRGCMLDVIEFINKLEDERKKESKA